MRTCTRSRAGNEVEDLPAVEGPGATLARGASARCQACGFDTDREASRCPTARRSEAREAGRPIPVPAPEEPYEPDPRAWLRRLARLVRLVVIIFVLPAVVWLGCCAVLVVERHGPDVGAAMRGRTQSVRAPRSSRYGRSFAPSHQEREHAVPALPAGRRPCRPGPCGPDRERPREAPEARLRGGDGGPGPRDRRRPEPCGRLLLARAGAAHAGRGRPRRSDQGRRARVRPARSGGVRRVREGDAGSA